NNDNPNFHVAVSKIISNFSGDNELRFELDKEVINSLTTPDVEFILYKLLGYFYPKEQLESLTFSITNFIGSGSISIANLYLDGYCNFILYNYPSSIKYLREKKQGATDLQLQVINAVEQFNEASDKNRKAKPKELSHSPERLQILFNQTNQGLNLENQKSKFKEASFLDMVKKVDLKTGDAFFTRGETGLQTLLNFKNRSRMSIVSANFEMPIGVITDPTGMEYRKFLWRIFKRSKR
ncbi:MAG TPA: hypothetical protein PKN96_12325, partial [Flavobacterium sp.]|uniref:hypothetical protein n=1 Tax=Flavobacterium sp. TaxID=239 RepID=UPI002C887F80